MISDFQWISVLLTMICVLFCYMGKMIHIEYTEIPSYKFSHLKGTCPLTHSPKLIFTKACHVRALSEAAVRQAPASGFLSLECLWTSFLTCKNSPLAFPNSLPSPQEMCPWFQHSPSKKQPALRLLLPLAKVKILEVEIISNHSWTPTQLLQYE